MGTNEDNYNVTILIAEDEESNFLLLKTILKDTVTFCSQNRPGAIESFAEKRSRFDFAGYKNAGNEWYTKL